MASKVLVPAVPFAKLKVSKSPSELPPVQGLVLGSEPAARIAHLEHSVRFLQEQHRLMLSGLHNEIEALRERNRDLQFQLIFNKESASKNSSRNTEDKENIAVEANEVATLKAEVLKLKHEAAAARSEARTAEARALQLQRLIDLQAEKLREREQKPCTGENCESLDATRGELRARLADAERLVRRLRSDAERQRRELQCMKNSLHASLRTSAGMEYGYQNYHFPAQPGPDFWREHQPHREESVGLPVRPARGRVSGRVLTLPELAAVSSHLRAHPSHAHPHRSTVYANQHTQPLQPHVTGYERPKRPTDAHTHNQNTTDETPDTRVPNARPNESVSNTVDLHITNSMVTYPELKVVIAKMIPQYNVGVASLAAPRARPRPRRARRPPPGAAPDHTHTHT